MTYGAATVIAALPQSYSVAVGRHEAARHAGARRVGPRWSAFMGIVAMGAGSVAGGLTLGLLSPTLPGVNWSTPVSAGTVTAPTPKQPKSASPDTPIDSVEPSDASAPARSFIPRTISILGVGDILVHREILQQAQSDGAGSVDFLPQLEGIRPLVQAVDLAICHMEYPLGAREGPWSVWPDPVNAPPQLADAIADLGFDACSTASNHAIAQGFSGVTSTIEALAQAGLPHAGTATSEEEAERITMLEVKGVPIAFLSYTYGFNGIPRPYDWCCQLIDNAQIVADATRARALGARLVVVSLHQGVEGIVRPTYEQSATATALAESGVVDLVLGHHAHIVQPVTKIGQMWVAYGHGNLLSAQSRRDPRTGDGLLTIFTFEERPDGSFAATDASGYALLNEDFPFRVIPVGAVEDSTPAAEATWARVSAQTILGDDSSGFTLRRLVAPASSIEASGDGWQLRAG